MFSASQEHVGLGEDVEEVEVVEHHDEQDDDEEEEDDDDEDHQHHVSSIEQQQVVGTGRKARIHRSLPRVRAILADETYLQGILQAVETSNCATQACATTSNEWVTAFHTTYETVATDCHLPLGKNRHHKFKDKIVELWLAMEQEILSERRSEAHPVYGMAMKQLATYRSVIGKRAGKTTAAVARVSNPTATTPLTGARKTAAASSSPSPAKRKKTAETKDAAAAAATTTTAASTATSNAPASSNNIDSTNLAAVFQAGLTRLEQLQVQQLPPKLPSPLNELARIVGQQHQPHQAATQNAATTAHLEKVYKHQVGLYLRQVTHQANNTTAHHPALLPTVLEGLDTLLHVPCQDMGLQESIRFTYRHVLERYLKLLESTHSRHTLVPSTTTRRTTTTNDSSASKRKASNKTTMTTVEDDNRVDAAASNEGTAAL